MADLDQAMKLMQSIGGRKQLDTSDMVNYAASKALDQMFERLQAPHVSAEEFQAAIEELKTAMESVAGLVGQIDTESGVAKVLTALKSLEGSVNRMTAAISNIKLPPPPTVNVPAPKDVDLSPVLESNRQVLSMLATMGTERVSNVVAEYQTEMPPKEWTFDVKRNQAGYIKSVEAKAK